MYSIIFYVYIFLFIFTIGSKASENITEVNPISKNVNGTRGKEVGLTCFVVDDAKISWFLNNKSIDALKIYKFENKSVSFTLEKNTVGEYMCQADEKVVNVYNVECPPYPDNENKVNKNAINGETFVFECKGFGNPPPVAQWFNNSKPLELGPRVSLKSSYDGVVLLMLNNSLRIQPVEYEDQGVYRCEVTNTHGNFSQEVEIHVKDKFAAMWPFLGICAEVAILCIIIFIYEKRRSKKAAAKEVAVTSEEADKLNPVKNGDDVRLRK